MAQFSIKQNDTLPSIRSVLKDAANNPIPLPGGTSVRFHLRQVNSTDIKVDAPATVEDSPTATVRYDWVDGDTDIAGDFLAEWEVQYSGGGKLSVPNITDITVLIYPELA